MDGANKQINRRSFFKLAGTGTAITAAAFTGCSLERADARGGSIVKEVPKGLMTYRPNPKTKEQVSLLGYGMMRLPNKTITTENGSEEVIDQDAVNDLVDYAIEHGVNYFDTSPVYCKGKSEESTGIALKRHPREKYFIAIKLSTFYEVTHNREPSQAILNNFFK